MEDIIEEWLKKHPIIDKDKQVKDKKKRKTKKSRYNAAYDKIIDLHGYNKEDAYSLIQKEIEFARVHHLRNILIIHGIGIHSKEIPVLKDLVIKIAKSNKNIEDFHQAPVKDGGEGATVLYLKLK